MRDDLAVPAEQLRPPSTAEWLDFETTEALPPPDAPVGQARAVAALETGIGALGADFHVFVSGPPGTGRAYAVRQFLANLAPHLPAPPDWCYLHSFHAPDQPAAVCLPAGRGRQLAHDLDAFIETSRQEILKAFESERFRERRSALHARYEQLREQAAEETSRRAHEQGFLVQFGPAGIAIVPHRGGEPFAPADYERLSEADRAALEQRAARVREDVEETFHRTRLLRKQEGEELETLNRDVASFAIDHLIADLLERYRDLPRVQQHLEEIRADLIKRFPLFLADDTASDAPAALLEAQRRETFNRYRASVLVDHAQSPGAPVVFETNPTYYNLLGKLDYRAEFGAMVTDFRMIKPGALLRANGGYLVLEAADLLRNPFAWEALARSLRNRQVHIENLSEQYGLAPSGTLKPEPIPLTVKVILIGEPILYDMLYTLDENFEELFRVQAEFDGEAACTPENARGYARYLASLCRERGLRHFDRAAVARLLQHSSRLVEDRNKLSARLLDLSSLAIEANVQAAKTDSLYVNAAHVDLAIAAREYRSNLLEEKVHERLVDGTVLIDVTGEAVGQVNGLTVYELGDYAFARPVRVTARTSLGEQGVINIEREADLSGPIHSKGVMILEGYLAHRFAQDHPLVLSASLAFEQSYSEVEGDSASSTELYALLSSLGGLPVRQDIAVTGSINQRGEIQPIGGVTLKVEGFFQVCRSKGLTGSQGVLIPASNLPHLLLKPEVVQAVEQGMFHIWAIRTVEEGIEILTGMRAGERSADGRYPAATVYGHVEARFRHNAERIRQFGAPPPRADNTRYRRGRGASRNAYRRR